MFSAASAQTLTQSSAGLNPEEAKLMFALDLYEQEASELKRYKKSNVIFEAFSSFQRFP